MNVLFVGLGGVGQRHLRNLLRLRPDARLAAVRHGNRLGEITDDLRLLPEVDIMARYNIRGYPSLEEAMEFAPDCAIVANPTSLHVATCAALVARRIPVLVEKPVGVEGDAVENLIELARQNRTLVAVAYQLRHHPCVQEARKWLAENRLGRLQAAEARVHSYMPAWHPYEDYRELYAGCRRLGGGVVLTEIHEIDLLTWFFGRPGPLWATGGRMSGLEIDVEDTVCVAMQMPRSAGSFMPVTLNLSFVQRPPSRHLAVFGEKGTLQLNIPADTLVLQNAVSGTVERFELTGFNRNQMFIDELEQFLACLESGHEADNALERCLDGHRTAVAIKQALASGQVVTP